MKKKHPQENTKSVAIVIAKFPWFASDHAERFTVFSIQSKHPPLARNSRWIE
jgi:hypothetical protein